MPYTYRAGELFCDDVSLASIADTVGTPAYVYSSADILSRFDAYRSAFGDIPHQICYAVKANANLSILRLLAERGAAFDIVSGGELYRVLQAGGDPSKIVFSGVGKTAAEMEYALDQGIHTFNCESEDELSLLSDVAVRRSAHARIALRVNPDVDAATHPYISTGLSEHKFGIEMSQVEKVYARAASLPNIVVEGVSCHIGSQILDSGPLIETVEKMIALVARLRGNGLAIRHLDLGGGLGVAYRSTEQAPAIADVVSGIRDRVKGLDLEIMVEPGRSIVAESGVLLTRVLYRKQTGRKEFLIVDGAMNDLIRPALYKSYHEVQPVRTVPGRGIIVADVVGPICETGDFFARDRDIQAVEPGELLVLLTAGAYGFAQASNYNSRPRAAEVLVEKDTWRVIRARESYADLISGE